MKTYPLPTGYLFTDSYSKGQLETLSIGDYGKAHNVKADFLGFTNPINGVPDTHCMPLSEKWVITVSTQYGCIMDCTFCDVPKVSWRGNASFEDLKAQFYSALRLFPGVRYTERLNLHFARMGEPIFNQAVFDFARWLYQNKREIKNSTGVSIEVIHPVLTTSLPAKLPNLKERLLEWIDIKNNLYNGQAGLQFSINSTNEAQRQEMFNGMSLTLEQFAEMAKDFPEPVSRKYCLNFAYSTDFEIDGQRLAQLFNPDYFMCKITPIHNNNACRDNQIQTVDGYTSYQPYSGAEASLIAAGFDVLVFVPSMDEEAGIVTCGNAVLGGSELATEGRELLKIHGIPITAV